MLLCSCFMTIYSLLVISQACRTRARFLLLTTFCRYQLLNCFTYLRNMDQFLLVKFCLRELSFIVDYHWRMLHVLVVFLLSKRCCLNQLVLLLCQGYGQGRRACRDISYFFYLFIKFQVLYCQTYIFLFLWIFSFLLFYLEIVFIGNCILFKSHIYLRLYVSRS